MSSKTINTLRWAVLSAIAIIFLTVLITGLTTDTYDAPVSGHYTVTLDEKYEDSPHNIRYFEVYTIKHNTLTNRISFYANVYNQETGETSRRHITVHEDKILGITLEEGSNTNYPFAEPRR